MWCSFEQTYRLIADLWLRRLLFELDLKRQMYKIGFAGRPQVRSLGRPSLYSCFLAIMVPFFLVPIFGWSLNVRVWCWIARHTSKLQMTLNTGESCDWMIHGSNFEYIWAGSWRGETEFNSSSSSFFTEFHPFLEKIKPCSLRFIVFPSFSGPPSNSRSTL